MNHFFTYILSDPPMEGAVSASKKTVKQVFKETLSPYIALSSHTDTLLRNRLAQTTRVNNVGICVFVWVSVCVSESLFVCLCVSKCLFVCLSLCLCV